MRSDDLVDILHMEGLMIKGLLIAGLMGSVTPTDNHLATHYQNNTYYEQFNCEACKKNKFEEVQINYVNNRKLGSYVFMDNFLEAYPDEVVKFLEYTDMHEKTMQHYCNMLIEILKEKTLKKTFHGGANFEHPEYVSFHVTYDGLLLFDKPFQLK